MGPARPARQVEQGTFDNIVRESIDDFGLTPEEAVEDAIEQLKKTGITDFSNLNTRPPSTNVDANGSRADPRDEVDGAADASSSLLSTLKCAIEQHEGSEFDAVSHAVNDILALMSDPAGRITNTTEAIELCASAIALSVTSGNPLFILPCCQLVTALCAKDDANRHRFSVGATDNIAPLKTLLSNLATGKATDVEPFIDSSTYSDAVPDYEQHVLRSISAVLRRNERAKRRLAADKSPEHIIALFQCFAKRAFQSPVTFSLVCLIIIQLLAAGGDGNDIDPRVGISEAFPRARIFSGEHTVTESGLRPLTNRSDNLIIAVTAALSFILGHSHLEKEVDGNGLKPKATMGRSILRECLSVANACAQSDDMCKALDDGGIITTCADVLTRFGSTDEALALVTLQLLGKLAQRDSCKSRIFQLTMKSARGTAAQWADDNERIAAALCTLVAQLCLRRPDLSREAATNGVAADITRLMNIHKDSKALSRVGCYAVRNMCSRDEHARALVRKDGVAERLFRDLMKRWPRDCDAAYYALKEMDVLADNELRWDSRYGARPTGMTS